MAGIPNLPAAEKAVGTTPEVHLIGGFVDVNAFLIVEAGDHYLIDTGFSERATHVLETLSSNGVEPKSLKGILLTHQHMDHMGGAARLNWLSGAPVSAHRLDAKALEGVGPRTSPLFVRILFNRHPVKVTNALHDSDTVGPFTAIHMPGHTPGSVAYYLKSRGFLFTGDALIVSKSGNLTLPRRSYSYDPESAAASLKKLKGLHVSAIFPGHGTPVATDASQRLEEAIERQSEDDIPESKTLFGPEGRPEIHPGMPGWREG